MTLSELLEELKGIDPDTWDVIRTSRAQTPVFRPE